MKCFVSGGAGVIGRELVSRLIAQGHSITVGDLQPRPKEFPDSVYYAHGDLNHLTYDFECDVFYHLAATFERLAESENHWDENFRHNVGLSHHLLSIIKAKRVVFASSYLVDPQPRNLTGAAKLYTENELEFLWRHRGLNSVSARIYRSYGCGSRDVISRWVRAALSGETIHVHNDQTQLDFIYAGDVAEALIRLGENDYTGVVPLGSGASRTIENVVSILSSHFPNLQVTRAVDQNAAERGYKCNLSVLRSILRWTPSTSLEEGIQKIIGYERCGR